MIDDEPVLTDPWWDLRGDTDEQQQEIARITRELEAELTAGHVLHGAKYEVIGRCFARDDVLLRMATGGFAIAHLTYVKRERLPAPSTVMFASAEAVEREIALRDGEY